MHLPLFDGLAYPFDRLVANRRGEANETDPSLISRFSWPECEAEKIELLILMTAWPVAVLTVDNLGLLRVQFQPAFPHPTIDRPS